MRVLVWRADMWAVRGWPSCWRMPARSSLVVAVGAYADIRGASVLFKYGLRAFTGLFAEPLVQATPSVSYRVSFISLA